jgi:hypothetical protein
MKVEGDYLGRERGREGTEEVWEGNGDVNTIKVLLYTVWKCHNERHYFIQLVYANESITKDEIYILLWVEVFTAIKSPYWLALTDKHQQSILEVDNQFWTLII